MMEPSRYDSLADSPASESLDGLIIATARCGIAVYDAAGQCRQVNPAAAKIAGGTVEQLLKLNYRQLPSWQQSGLGRMADDVLATGAAQAGTFQVATTFGRKIRISCQFSRFEKNQEPFLLVMACDTPPPGPADEMAARHAVIIESSNDAIMSKTPDGIITTWNQGAEKMFGYTAREAIGRSMDIIIPPDRRDEEWKILSLLRRGEPIRQFETLRLHKDGTPINISATISPILNPAGRVIGITKIARDITEYKALEAQFRQSQKMEAVGRLAGGVAHDFNNLLTIIQGYGDLSLRDVTTDHPLRNYLTEIKKAGERAAALTRQLLAFSRKQILVTDVCDLNSLVAGCENMLGRLLGEDIELVTVPDAKLGPVRVDPSQLEQALINLAINARDAMPQGGRLTIETTNIMVDESARATHPELSPGGHVMLAVSDTGCGMDAATQARVFEPFFTTKEPGKGTGLGLAMVFGFIKQSGGHISVTSEPGRGSSFKIYFPREAADNRTEIWPASEPLPDGAGTILLVEDEPELRKLARLILVLHGYTVIEAVDGREALLLAQKHPGRIDLLLSDVVMPVMGGRQLAEQLAEIRPGVKVLFMSGYMDDAVMRHGVSAAENAFIQKPFTMESLPVEVKKILGE